MEKNKTERYKITKELESLKESKHYKEIQSQDTETLEMSSERKQLRQHTFLSFVDERRQEILESC